MGPLRGALKPGRYQTLLKYWHFPTGLSMQTPLDMRDLLARADVARFDLSNVVRLLTGERDEYFEYERAIRLFQFQLWMLSLGNSWSKLAVLTAATKLLDRILDDDFVDEESARQQRTSNSGISLTDRPIERLDSSRARIPAFEKLFEATVNKLGGMPALLDALPPAQLDTLIWNQIQSYEIVSDLLSYRVRYVLTMSSDVASTVKHAKHFVWYPTRETRPGQGRSLPGVPPSFKTMEKKWKDCENTGVFLFLNSRCGFKLYPTSVDDDFFAENLLRSAETVDELRRFFGAYAYLREALEPEKRAMIELTVPRSVPRVAISVDPFTSEELNRIQAYDPNFMDGYDPG
jgi:hypothetical protein